MSGEPYSRLIEGTRGSDGLGIEGRRRAEHKIKNINTAPAARIRRVVLDQPAKAADLMYSQASSIVISDAEDTMITKIMALQR